MIPIILPYNEVQLCCVAKYVLSFLTHILVQKMKMEIAPGKDTHLKGAKIVAHAHFLLIYI